jgi:hypothetical protein
LAETGLTPSCAEMVPHDYYHSSFHKVEQLDLRKASGHEMSVVCKKNFIIHPIDELLNDKQCAFRIHNRDEKTGIIAAGYYIIN